MTDKNSLIFLHYNYTGHKINEQNNLRVLKKELVQKN
jgi:hypothetical protein